MTFRRCRLALVVALSLSLCGCSTAAESVDAPPAAGGSVELAVSETCAEGSDPQCILFGDDHVTRPSTFERARVADAEVSDDQQQNAVDITFTAEGAAVLNDLTGQAARAGDESRLLFKVGEEVVAAVVVMEAIQGDQVTIALPPEHTPQEVLGLLHST